MPLQRRHIRIADKASFSRCVEPGSDTEPTCSNRVKRVILLQPGPVERRRRRPFQVRSDKRNMPTQNVNASYRKSDNTSSIEREAMSTRPGNIEPS